MGTSLNSKYMCAVWGRTVALYSRLVDTGSTPQGIVAVGACVSATLADPVTNTHMHV